MKEAEGRRERKQVQAIGNGEGKTGRRCWAKSPIGNRKLRWTVGAVETGDGDEREEEPRRPETGPPVAAAGRAAERRPLQR